MQIFEGQNNCKNIGMFLTIDKKIKLLAYTESDLDIISHLCQDAILSKEEFFFDKEKKIFVATLSRYCWEKEDAKSNKDDKVYYRVVCGLQIKNVIGINYKNYNKELSFLNLLAITHKENKIFLHFSKSMEIILNCKKISILIEDIDIPWPTKLKPKHNVK